MGYRDDFFKRENIIGITGPVHELPSVYFKDKATGEFGHITQVHKHSFNWGRTEVRKDAGWKITNDCPASCGCKRVTSHEINGSGHVFHKSRSVFVPVDKLSADDLNVVAEAIHRCPHMKSDPHTKPKRHAEELRYMALWAERHDNGPTGRRGAIDYTGEGLANQALKIAYPARAN